MLAITRIEPVSTIHGRSLSPLWQGTPIAADSVVDLASVVSVASHDHLLTTASNGYRFIVNATQGHNELYDIEADPLEQYNLADSIPGVAADLEELLWKLVSEYVGTTGARSRTSIDRKTIERLKSLGYL